MLSEIVLEKLLEQRDFYLNTIKHLEFQLVMDPSEEEILENKKFQTTTIEQLKNVEQEISSILSDQSSNLQ